MNDKETIALLEKRIEVILEDAWLTRLSWAEFDGRSNLDQMRRIATANLEELELISQEIKQEIDDI